MTSSPKILAFAGSVRKDSFNQKVVEIAAQGATAAGAEVTVVDLAELPMPIYNGDLENAEGLPENAKKFKVDEAANQAALEQAKADQAAWQAEQDAKKKAAEGGT